MWFLPIFGTAAASGEGTGTGTAVATGSAVGQSLFTANGSGTAVATGSAVGASLFTADGLGTAVATGLASGASLFTAIGEGIAVATGLAVGTFTYTLTLTAAQAIRLEAIFRLHGLIDPLVVSPTSRGDGAVTQTMSGSVSVTVHTTGLPATGAPTAALIDKLARWYGLIDDMVESEASRTDGTLSQTVVTVGTVTTVTTL